MQLKQNKTQKLAPAKTNIKYIFTFFDNGPGKGVDLFITPELCTGCCFRKPIMTGSIMR